MLAPTRSKKYDVRNKSLFCRISIVDTKNNVPADRRCCTLGKSFCFAARNSSSSRVEFFGSAAAGGLKNLIRGPISTIGVPTKEEERNGLQQVVKHGCST